MGRKEPWGGNVGEKSEANQEERPDGAVRGGP